ncbi:ATP-binding protein [soil metagenome]
MNHSVLKVCWVVVLFVSIFVCAGAQQNTSAKSGDNDVVEQVKEGEFDFSLHDFERDGQMELSGTWEFYWEKLLSPSDFAEGPTPAYIKVPGSWHRQGDYSTTGYGTYRAHLRLPKSHEELSIYFPYINSASRIWVNGDLLTETGNVSADREVYRSQLTSILLSLPEREENIEIIIQVANYSYFSAGISSTPQIDKTEAIFRRAERSNGIENFFAGSLMAMFIYQMVLYFLVGRKKPYLWLSLICLCIATRSLIVHGGSFLLPNLLPSLGWEFWKTIEFGGVYSVIALFPLYIYHLFPLHAPKKPLIFFLVVAGLMCLTVLVTPQYIYGGLLEVCHIMLLLTFAYAIYSITKAWRAKSSDAKIILFGILVAFPFILMEIAKNSILFYPMHFEYMYMVELGLLIFLLFQVYLLANHYAKAFKNLETVNLNLEKMVTERTSQLTTANAVKDRLLSVMSHDIKSPLNSLRGILQIYNKGSITQQEFGQLARHIENDLSKTNLLVENIVYWTASQLKGVQLRREKFDLSMLIEEILQLFQTIASNKKVVIKHNVERGFTIFFDRNILNFVIRNLVANAMKFSFEGGEINVLASREKGQLQIQIRDQGVGMDEATVHDLLRPDRLVSATGTGNEKGTGLGVALCLDYLQKAGGQLSVESVLGMGSIFTISLPLESGRREAEKITSSFQGKVG